MVFKLLFISIFIVYATGHDTKTNYQYNENNQIKVCTFFNIYIYLKGIIKSIYNN